MQKLVLIALLGLLAACSNTNSEERIRISAAASMTDGIGALAMQYSQITGHPVETNFGASSTLAKQIHDGAPADVYVSASREWIDYLRKREHLQGEPVVIARNRIVCVTQKDSSLERKDIADLAARPCLIAVADEGVPAGEYTRQALTKAGVLKKLTSSLVGQKDARAVVSAVQSGNTPVGFVYSSDAYNFEDSLRVLFVVPADMHDSIEYYAALLKNAEHPEAARGLFLYLQSEKAQDELSKLGFIGP
ncbi:MAG: molybdate ABC transporter substrate-binding protein [Planctomycetes bacterium]|nr:molybdate ABC transporter substrate-binding protein [Planctomycetota bacterium]